MKPMAAYSAVPTSAPEDIASNQDAYLKASGPNGRVFLSRRNESDIGRLPEEISARLATAKALDVLGGIEYHGACAVEKDSVYGAAIAIPQIARSGGWSKSMLCLTVRAYLFVVVNFLVQTLLVYYIYDSQTNMNPFGGQMHLCDFAAHIDNCPNAPNCHGPGGREIPDPGALYLFDIWYTRKFVRDTLQAMFPDRRDEIQDTVDPGEYGVESYSCRLLCIFVFIVGIADEFQNTRDLAKLLYHLPTGEGMWVEYIPPDESKLADRTSRVDELDSVRFFVSGMPLRWKVLNLLVILLPRIFIWRMLTMAGVNFLMETAAMSDLIVNTTALAFVLETDELILERLGTRTTRHIMTSLQDYEIFDQHPTNDESDEAALDRYSREETSWSVTNGSWWLMHMWLLPNRLFWSIFLLAIFVGEYYYHACKQTEDGSWVSKDMYLPARAHLDYWRFAQKFFSMHHEHEGDEVWSMT